MTTEGRAGRRRREGTSKVLIVDDHPIVRYGLKELVDAQPDLTVCADAEDIASALAAHQEHKPHIAVIDLSLETGSGLDLLRQLRSRDDRIRMLVNSIHDESLFASRAIQAGAHGFVNKQEAPSRILEAIRIVLDGGMFVSNAFAQKVLGASDEEIASTREVVERLTDREIEVFELIGRGLSTRHIADCLHVSRKTIEAHRESIKAKLELSSGTELSTHAMRWVLTTERALPPKEEV